MRCSNTSISLHPQPAGAPVDVEHNGRGARVAAVDDRPVEVGEDRACILASEVLPLTFGAQLRLTEDPGGGVAVDRPTDQIGHDNAIGAASASDRNSPSVFARESIFLRLVQVAHLHHERGDLRVRRWR